MILVMEILYESICQINKLPLIKNIFSYFLSSSFLVKFSKAFFLERSVAVAGPPSEPAYLWPLPRSAALLCPRAWHTPSGRGPGSQGGHGGTGTGP